MSKPCHITIVDDHAVFRYGLRQVLTVEKDVSVIAEAESGKALFELPYQKRKATDVYILDVSLPGENGIEVLNRLLKENKSYKVLILTMYADPHFGLKILQEGACGYLTKESDPDIIIEAIKTIFDKKKVIPSSISELLLDLTDPQRKMPLHEQLSVRELEVLILISEGKTITEIAGELHISVKTVSTYRGRILTKLKVSNNADIVRYAIRCGLAIV
jgi:two-component system, NarL family, invasion response regulator UvrY